MTTLPSLTIMCINIRIEQLQQQKADIDAKLQQLESLQQQTNPLMTAIANLSASYRDNAPEELPALVEQILSAMNIKDSVAAITQSAIEHDAAALQFAATSIESAIEQRTAEAFTNVSADEPAALVAEQSAAVEASAVSLHDEKTQDLAKSILAEHGFFMPDLFLGDCYSPEDKYEDYENWSIYYQRHDRRGINGIGLYSEQFGFWDAGTEMIGEDDPTFPQDFADYDAIVAWTHGVIDEIEASASNIADEECLSGEEYDRAVEEELALDDDQEPDLVSLFTVVMAEIPSFETIYNVLPALNNGKLAGATFQFFDAGWKQLFTQSQTVEELSTGEYNVDLIATAIFAAWKRRQEAAKLPPPSAFTAENSKEDEFTEFVEVGPTVGYLKRRDNGQILSAYIGFSNKTEAGDRTITMASNRAKKWAESLEGDLGAKCEVRKPKRMTSTNPAMPFAYEVKIVGLSAGQIQKLSEENFNLLPYEMEEKQEKKELLHSEVLQPVVWELKINGYPAQSGTPAEIEEAFTTQLNKLMKEGSRTLSIHKGHGEVEDYRINDFQFVEVPDFDKFAPEYYVLWNKQTNIRVWSTVRSNSGSGGTQRVWRHNLLATDKEAAFTSKEAAAIHAVRRNLKLT